MFSGLTSKKDASMIRFWQHMTTNLDQEIENVKLTKNIERVRVERARKNLE